MSTSLTLVGLETSNTISANYTVASGMNALVSGPITLSSGVVITISTGAVWTIV